MWEQDKSKRQENFDLLELLSKREQKKRLQCVRLKRKGKEWQISFFLFFKVERLGLLMWCPARLCLDYEVNSCEVQVAVFAFTCVINILGEDSDITAARFVSDGNILHSLDFEDSDSIIFDFGIVRKVADSFANEGRCDFDCWCLVVYVHFVLWLWFIVAGEVWQIFRIVSTFVFRFFRSIRWARALWFGWFDCCQPTQPRRTRHARCGNFHLPWLFRPWWFLFSLCCKGSG